MKRTIVCLCGSTRFSEAFQKANLEETLLGRVVLSIGCDTKSDAGAKIARADKAKLDALHKDKIALADEVLILNVDGYVGESTRSEIVHALALGKRIRFLEREIAEVLPVNRESAAAEAGVLNGSRRILLEEYAKPLPLMPFASMERREQLAKSRKRHTAKKRAAQKASRK